MSENKPDTSLSLTMLRAEVFAQGCMLRAIAQTHPDKEKLREHFGHFTEQFMSTALAHPTDETSLRAFEMSVQRFLKFIA